MPSSRLNGSRTSAAGGGATTSTGEKIFYDIDDDVNLNNRSFESSGSSHRSKPSSRSRRKYRQDARGRSLSLRPSGKATHKSGSSSNTSSSLKSRARSLSVRRPHFGRKSGTGSAFDPPSTDGDVTTADVVKMSTWYLTSSGGATGGEDSSYDSLVASAKDDKANGKANSHKDDAEGGGSNAPSTTDASSFVTPPHPDDEASSSATPSPNQSKQNKNDARGSPPKVPSLAGSSDNSSSSKEKKVVDSLPHQQIANNDEEKDNAAAATTAAAAVGKRNEEQAAPTNKQNTKLVDAVPPPRTPPKTDKKQQQQQKAGGSPPQQPSLTESDDSSSKSGAKSGDPPSPPAGTFKPPRSSPTSVADKSVHTMSSASAKDLSKDFAATSSPSRSVASKGDASVELELARKIEEDGDDDASEKGRKTQTVLTSVAATAAAAAAAAGVTPEPQQESSSINSSSIKSDLYAGWNLAEDEEDESVNSYNANAEEGGGSSLGTNSYGPIAAPSIAGMSLADALSPEANRRARHGGSLTGSGTTNGSVDGLDDDNRSLQSKQSYSTESSQTGLSNLADDVMADLNFNRIMHGRPKVNESYDSYYRNTDDEDDSSMDDDSASNGSSAFAGRNNHGRPPVAPVTPTPQNGANNNSMTSPPNTAGSGPMSVYEQSPSGSYEELGDDGSPGAARYLLREGILATGGNNSGVDRTTASYAGGTPPEARTPERTPRPSPTSSERDDSSVGEVAQAVGGAGGAAATVLERRESNGGSSPDDSPPRSYMPGSLLGRFKSKRSPDKKNNGANKKNKNRGSSSTSPATRSAAATGAAAGAAVAVEAASNNEPSSEINRSLVSVDEYADLDYDDDTFATISPERQKIKAARARQQAAAEEVGQETAPPLNDDEDYGDSYEVNDYGKKVPKKKPKASALVDMSEVTLQMGLRKRDVDPQTGQIQWGDYTGDVDPAGNRHGRGLMSYDDGSSYDGHWSADVRHGEGKMLYANGDMFTGTFDNDKREGAGTMLYHTGGVYEGRWKRDQRHGHGTRRYPDGKVYTGNWSKGVRDGQGVCWYANRDVYRGTFKGNRKEGVGTYKWKDGRYDIGTYRYNDIMPGESGVRWNKERTKAYKLVPGKVKGEMSLAKAAAFAKGLGLSVPAK